MGFPPLTPSQTQRQTRLRAWWLRPAKPTSANTIDEGELGSPQSQRGTRVCSRFWEGAHGGNPISPVELAAELKNRRQ